MGGSHVTRRALPAQPTAFVGRRNEIPQLRRLLSSSRLVTLAGPPGVGKTRLALRIADEVIRRFRDGVWVVELEGLRDPSLIAQEVARALDLHDASMHWAVETLAQHVGDRRLLLLLDNCEHVLDACALLVGSLLRSCPHLHVIATSRQSLGITGEAVFRVAPLSIPERGSVDGEAIELLLDRAASVLGGEMPDQEERLAAAELCRRLDGIPLAIELAAVRLKTLSVRQLLDRLDDRFRVLGDGGRSAPPHRRTLRAALDWSYALLTPEEQMLWQELSVFPGSFDLTAVEAVCVDDDSSSRGLVDVLDGLVDKSIVVAARMAMEMRYRMLESIREYGLEELRSSGDEPGFRSRHLEHYAGLCREAWNHWTDADQPRWFERLEVEHGNVRAALDWCIENDEPGIGCSMASDLWLYWEARGHLTEGRRRLAALLEGHLGQDRGRAKALWVAGYLALGQNDVDAGVPLLRQSWELAAAIGDDESAAFATQYLGLARLFLGDPAGAITLLEDAFERHHRIGQGAAAFTLSDVATARMLGGDPAGAKAFYEKALAMMEDDGDPWTRSHCLWGLGMSGWLTGDASAAERSELEALRLSSELDERSGIALSLEVLAWIAASRGQFERSARVHGAARSVWESIPRHIPEPLREHTANAERSNRRALGDERYANLVEEAGRLDRIAAVAVGLGHEGPRAPARSTQKRRGVLTPRELEVADLVARGMTDREIAAELIIGQRTAESHVQHILTKLGFRSRSQIAVWAATVKGQDGT